MSSIFSYENKNNFSLHLSFPDEKALLLSRMERATRVGSRTAATSKMERFEIIVKRSILDVAAVLDPPLTTALYL